MWGRTEGEAFSQEFDVCCCEIIRAEIVHCQLRCRSNWRSPKKCWEGAAKLFSEDDGCVSVAVVQDGFCLVIFGDSDLRNRFLLFHELLPDLVSVCWADGV